MAAEAGAYQVAVVEDDAEYREQIVLPGLIAAGLDAHGFDGAAALYRAMLARRFSLVVLDIHLPGEDGISIAAHLRASGDIGIVMLSAHGGDAERLRAFAAGADVFMAKPVTMAVLGANLQRLGSRLAAAPAAQQAIAPAAQWQLAPDGWTLVAPEGQRIELSAQERRLLRRLCAEPGQPAGREALIAELTDAPLDYDPHRLDMLVHRLRRRVRASCGQCLPLRTLRGRGYVWLPQAQADERRRGQA